MQRFTAKLVIEAARSGRYLAPESRNDQKAFSLITADEVNLSLAGLDAVQDLIHYIEDGYKVRLRIISGGAGCARFDFELEGCPQDAAQFVDALMNDVVFLEKAAKLNFRVFFFPDGAKRNPHEYLKWALKTTIRSGPIAKIAAAPLEAARTCLKRIAPISDRGDRISTTITFATLNNLVS